MKKLIYIILLLSFQAYAGTASWPKVTLCKDNTPCHTAGYNVYCAAKGSLDYKKLFTTTSQNDPVTVEIIAADVIAKCGNPADLVFTAYDDYGNEGEYSKAISTDYSIPSAPVITCEGPVNNTWVVYSGNNCGSGHNEPCLDSPLKDSSFRVIGRVAKDVLCENEAIRDSTGGTEYHYTTNHDGLRGITRCRKQ